MAALIRTRRSAVLGTWYFLKILGLCYLTAFGSLWVQVHGLLGRDGITPVDQFLEMLLEHYGTKAYSMRPTLFWLSGSDLALDLVCALGCFFSVLLVAGRMQRLAAFLLWLLYLSLLNGDYVFLQFQWDHLLVETGFLAIFLAPNTVTARLSELPIPHGDLVFMLRWLLFRLMFSSGVVKLASGDEHWRSLRALDFHFLTQPLPNLPAYYAAKLPPAVLYAMTGMTFFVELIVPWFFFGPRRLRHLAALLTAGFQFSILATGNYTYFNLLTIGVCCMLVDDQAFSCISLKPIRNRYFLRSTQSPAPTAISPVLGLALCYLLFLGAVELGSLFVSRDAVPKVFAKLGSYAQPLHLVNPYGLFAVMTTVRHEIVIEGSNDNKSWLPYVNRWKPGETSAPPHQAAPHQPRLDWQLWFAALTTAKEQPWFLNLLYRLHQGSGPVVGLFGNNPFPDAPPKYLRAVAYDCRFSSMSEHQISGAWWERKLLGFYFPAISFDESSPSSASR